MNANSAAAWPLISVVTPAFCEQDNLAALHKEICAALDELEIRWEWIIVDDHSPDSTFAVAGELAKADSRVKAIRLARNAGSHVAIMCGLEHAAGDCSVVLAADLQDPPDLIEMLIEKWRRGAHIVWAVRRSPGHKKVGQVIGGRIYYDILGRIGGFSEMPATGADFFLIDRVAIDGLARFQERNVSVYALIHWMGFRQDCVEYDKNPRVHGSSGWTLSRKIKLFVDTVVSFSHGPIQFMSLFGAIVAMFGFLYAGFVVFEALSGETVQGWSSLIVAILIIGGVQISMLGVLGEYLWRTSEETRKRPRYLIEDTTPSDGETSNSRVTVSKIWD